MNSIAPSFGKLRRDQAGDMHTTITIPTITVHGLGRLPHPGIAGVKPPQKPGVRRTMADFRSESSGSLDPHWLWSRASSAKIAPRERALPAKSPRDTRGPRSPGAAHDRPAGRGVQSCQIPLGSGTDSSSAKRILGGAYGRIPDPSFSGASRRKDNRTE